MIKRLILKIPFIRNIFINIESNIFDIFRIFNIRRYIGKSSKISNKKNEEIILKFETFYNKYYSNDEIKIFIKYLEERVKSAWRGHHFFALWLINELKPNIIVDLGVDRGFSTFIFSAQNIGKVYGIDWFKRFKFLKKEIDDYFPIMRNKRKLEKKFKIKNLTLIKSDFSEVAKKWNKDIDILHIDGSHSYEEVKKDFNTWNRFLNENSVILFHDTNSCEGVTQFFNELDLPKYNFTHSHGLGIASKNRKLILKIIELWNTTP